MKNEPQAVNIFLRPGEYAVGDASCRISTLLGSCVAIALWHPQRKIGAMSHFLLPHRGSRINAYPDGRYGDEVIGLMLWELKQLGVDAAACHAKIFGGGRMLLSCDGAPRYDIGKRNGETARQLLQAVGIPIVSESLFGVGHRKIVFDVASGDVWSRQRMPSHVHASLPPSRGSELLSSTMS